MTKGTDYMGGASVASRRLKLALTYVLKLKSLLENPAFICVFDLFIYFVMTIYQL